MADYLLEFAKEYAASCFDSGITFYSSLFYGTAIFGVLFVNSLIVFMSFNPTWTF